MVIDSSVLIQILFGEDGAKETVLTLGQTPNLKIATPTLLETEIVYGSRKGFNLADVRELLSRLDIEIVEFTDEHVLEAKLAFSRFGKGQKHPAKLNFGDCVSYALAKVLGETLAFKGDDFKHTDIDFLEFR